MFPDFNIHSLPLLILVIQGLIFVCLLFIRYFKKKQISDAFLGLILLLTSYFQICYTVGFMGWYNEFRTTKINYFLLSIAMALAPLIYFYVKSITTSQFKFKPKHWLHFIPALLFVIFRISIYTYDAAQPGFDDVQNGILKLKWDEPFAQPIVLYLGTASMLLYLAFTFELFYNYRKRIIQYFSNTYQLELNWILIFLVLFTLSFLYGTIQEIVGGFIELHYVHRWWLNLFVALITLFVGIKGYFTNTNKLNNLDFKFSPRKVSEDKVISMSVEKKSISEDDKQKVNKFMIENEAFLDPELNLSDLAKATGFTRAKLSEIINTGFQKNFNDYVNSYRIEAFKEKLKSEKHQQLSLLGLAFECGFNSKATFNRVFKKLTNSSPTEYLKTAI